MRKLNALLLVASLTLVLYSCGGDDNDGPVYNTAVGLESVSADGCLNVPQYFTGIQSLDPATPVLEISTDYSVSSQKSIREKFRTLMAYSTFRAGHRPLNEFGEFTSLSQHGCAELVVHSADNTSETYPITVSTRESVRAEMPDGRAFQYTWISPTRMVIDHAYHAMDLPCGTETPVLVRQRRVLDWGNTPLESLDLSAEPFKVSDSYMAKVANAVGVSAGNLYDDGKLVPAKLAEMAAKPPRSDLLSCNSGEAPRPPSPEEPEVPSEP